MEALTATAAFAGLIYTATQLYKFVEAKRWASVRTQLAAWAIGVTVTLLAGETSFAEGIPTIGDANLAIASVVDRIFAGLTFAGVAGTLFSFKRAVDETDTDAAFRGE